jgi:hypothetical protein
MRRRRFWIIVAVVAAAVLVMWSRPDGEGEAPADSGGTPGGQPPPAAVAARPTDERVPAPSTAPSPVPQPEPPHEPSGVTGEEGLDPAAVPGALQAAEQFASLWSTPDPQWYERLASLATPALAGSLASAEPPATARRIVGDGEVYFDAPEWARVGVPAETGTVVLDVVVVDGQWLVSAVDWWPS